MQDKDGQTLLHFSTKQKKRTITKILLEYGADPNIKDDKGDTPLYWAVSNGRNDIVKLLLSYNANLMFKQKKENFLCIGPQRNSIKRLSKFFSLTMQTPIFKMKMDGHLLMRVQIKILSRFCSLTMQIPISKTIMGSHHLIGRHKTG